jgi:predicted 3-demethylubiquinone-9 3-methyltransferase (glyoxalase superfamily)
LTNCSPIVWRPGMYCAGPLDPFNHASFIVNCGDQAEVDRLWDALSAGGTIEQCGWFRDRYGVSWQIVPTVVGEMMKAPIATVAGA